MKKNRATKTTMMKTITVDEMVSLRVGHVTLLASCLTLTDELARVCLRHVVLGFWCRFSDISRSRKRWQEWRDSNPQPPVLETGALPIELHSSGHCALALQRLPGYSMMPVTTPAPTVRPPSRMAKRRPSSMAIGAIRFTCIAMLSPGITISVPSGSSTVPVTSVVRK